MQGASKLSPVIVFLDQRSLQEKDSLLPAGILRTRTVEGDHSIVHVYHHRSKFRDRVVSFFAAALDIIIW